MTLPKLILIVLIAIAAFWIFQHFLNPSKPSTTNAISVNSQQISDSSASINYQIRAQYPQISGLTNAQTQAQLNAAIYNQVNTDVTNFKSSLNQSLENPNLPASLKMAGAQFIVTYTVAQANNQIVSVQFSIEDAEPGMAHPNNYNQVFNYNVATNQQIQLADLFKPNSNYLQTLSTMSRTQLLAQHGNSPDADFFINQGTAPTAQNFDLFVLTPTDLVIIFDPAQVAPSANGTQQVNLPLSQLSGILINPL